MRANGLIHFVLLTSATAGLMGLVTRPASGGKNDLNDEYGAEYTRTFPPDSPEVEAPVLPFDFKDNQGRVPLLEPKSKFYLENPENIKTGVKYDPSTGNYDVEQKIGETDYRPDTYMSKKEFQDYMFRKQMRDYFRSRVAADELNEKPRKGMIPPLKVNSELFDRIFGGNTVDIKPTGTAELLFGLVHTKNQNPAIPQKQQSITNFDFNMRIQLNLVGKIGDKLKVTTNYNTEASFDWENQIKVDYTGYEDEIIKKIEAGNVSLPLNTTLISGSQTLFGFKTELQFGRLRATTVFSQQKGKKQEVTVQGGAQTQSFAVSGDNYEQNKHYFLGHYFRVNYDRWMASLPVINTPIVITKIEVYLLGINGNAEQTRNVAAFEDLGEDANFILPSLQDLNAVTPASLAIVDTAPNDSLPRNEANNLYSIMTNTVDGILRERSIDKVTALLSTSSATASNANNSGGIYMDGSRDYNIIRNARKLNPTEYYFNPRTGFISLNQQLNNEQSLAVSYQYTYGGQTFQVGEFSEQVADNSRLIVCKLLKTNAVSVRHPMWKLMMKNVYTLGAYNLNSDQFKLNVFYNNIETGVDVPYLPYGKPNGVQLINVLGCDRLSVNGDKGSDGIFDFLDGYTIVRMSGRVYFPKVEPFGRGLEEEFAPEDVDKDKYIFKELYDSTKTAASFIQSKNRYRIKGTYKSSSGSEIALNALNIPQGAVLVTANGVPLQENADYTVDYTLGRVKIINEGLLSSGATIKVSLESNSLFQVQQKSLWGTRLDYDAGRHLKLGGTFLRFNERPLTQKVSFGDEPVSNIVAGTDFNYKNDVPFLTTLLDKLPFYSTKEMSSVSMRGEIAKLFPGNAKAISKSGNSYIDDFEGSVALIDIRSPTSWFLSSIPQGQKFLFPEAFLADSVDIGKNRARLNWYTIDAMFTRDQSGVTPEYYNSKKLFSNNMWRQVFETELFPGKTPPNGQQVVLPLLDLGFYPEERGPYNYDVKAGAFSKGITSDGSLASPETRWGGIMRRLETNDFQAANVEYIQFWLMDPFNEDYNQETDPSFDKNQLPSGDLYFNIGNISEDIIKDGRMSYENGISAPSTGSLAAFNTNLATVPAMPPVINAFSQDNNDRPAQDVGYDGLSDDNERARFSRAVQDMQNSGATQAAIDAFVNDPSSDNYNFFRDDQYDAEEATTLVRYSKYNNVQGNSPTEAQYGNANPNGGNYPTGATTLPNIEDINKDNTLSEAENYYQYHVKISPNDVNPNSIGTNFIVDAFKGTAEFSGVTKTVTWYQFKIPINQFEKVVGGIEGFNSIRFMRIFMKGFNRPVLLRMARLELVRSDWRRYTGDLREPGEFPSTDDNSTIFDISAVSLQENGTKTPVNYILPPEIEQQQNVLTTNLVLQNEQALQMRVCNLKDGDSRAIFKNVDLDTRMFENIKMNVHAEKLNDVPLNDGDLTLFFRVGSDYNNNFYEYEVPLKLTPKGVYNSNSTDDRYTVWPAGNEINFKFDTDITDIKTRRNAEYGYYSDLNQLSTPYSIAKSGYTVSIVGNPNLGNVKSIMVGVRNRKGTDNQAHCVEVWINELRLTDFNNQGGWATTGQLQAKLADLATVSLAGTYKSPFWGSVEQKINERSKEHNISWDVSTSLNAGKFFPDKWKVSLPVNYNFGRNKIIPLFNPLDPDVRMDALDDIPIPDSLRNAIKEQTIDLRERKGFSINGFRIDGLKRAKAKPMPWDISNFTATYAYTESSHNDVNIEYDIVKQHRASLQYAFALKSPPVFKPFAKSKLFSNKWFALIKDFNFQPLPSNFGFALDLNRNYSALKNRDITSFYDQGTDAFLNPSLINKNFLINRSYNFNWPISKSIKFDYTASNEGRILEPKGEVYSGINTNRDSIIDWFFHGNSQGQGQFGDNTIFRQQMNLNWDVPINKLPILDFVKATYRFSGTYTWNRKPYAVDLSDTTIANTIQNTGSHNITGSLSMTQLYNKIPYFKKINDPRKKAGAAQIKTQGGKTTDSKDAKVEEEKEEKPSTFEDIAEALARLVMMVKNVSLSFQQESGQALPNFIPNSQFMGMDLSNGTAPGFLFTTGLYDEGIRETSAKNGWITKNPNQNTSYTETRKQTYNYRLNIEPHSTFKIELNGNYSSSKSYNSYIVYDPTKPIDDRYDFNASPALSGNFNITTISIFKAFQDGNDPIKSDLFEEFMINRPNTAALLSSKNPNSAGLTGPPGLQYYDGYSNNQKDVLLNTFYETYTGQKIENYSTTNIFPKMALPNWTASWDGLGKIPILKKTFRSITVRHGYRSIYNINGYTNNILFNTKDGIQNVREPVSVSSGTNALSQNFVSYYNINSVTLSESFSPLIKFDFQFVKPGWSANVENKRDKTTTLNLTGFQIIETKGQEFIIGLGYMYPKLKFKNIRIQGKALESNLTVKVDLSFRRNVSIIRQVTDGVSTPTAGTDIVTLRSYIDYQLTQAINLRIYYDWIKTVPRTSASFPTSNTNAGFSIRINFQ